MLIWRFTGPPLKGATCFVWVPPLLGGTRTRNPRRPPKKPPVCRSWARLRARPHLAYQGSNLGPKPGAVFRVCPAGLPVHH